MPELTPYEELVGLANFILSMVLPNGACLSKLDANGQITPFTSLYYPGEAALGLIRFYVRTGIEAYKQAALKILVNLARTRSITGEYPADHWSVLATSEMLYLLSDQRLKKSLLRHSLLIVDGIIKEQNTKPTSELHGSFGMDGRLTPTTTRLEALGTAFIMSNGNLSRLSLDYIEKSIFRGANFVLRNQILDGQNNGGFPKVAKGMKLASKSIGKEIRIDYVQHALSALIIIESINKNHKGEMA